MVALWRLLTWADRLLILAAVAIAAGLLAHQRFRGQTGVEVVIAVEGKIQGIYPLDRAQILEVKGPLGTSVVEIGLRGARVISSPCANQLCVRQGWVQRSGGVVACVPNRLVLEIRGEGGRDTLDAVSR